MPPKKEFLGQVDYLSRNIHDDLLELLPKSTNESDMIKKLILVNIRLKVADGLYDRGNWIRDVITTKLGLLLF